MCHFNFKGGKTRQFANEAYFHIDKSQKGQYTKCIQITTQCSTPICLKRPSFNCIDLQTLICKLTVTTTSKQATFEEYRTLFNH